MKILIAPNAFKNSLEAVDAAEALSRGFQQSRLTCECKLQPIADGGDGMLSVLLDQKGGKVHQANVEDPLGRPITANYGLLEGRNTAVIEMAEASGIRLLTPGELNPMKASSYGTGQLISAALDAGVHEIVIGIGGSATVDLGLGIAQALGVQLMDESGVAIGRGGVGLCQLRHVDMSKLDPRIANTHIIVTCDVTNTLLEAPSVFGPQKGADNDMVAMLEKEFKRVGGILENALGKEVIGVKHGGAAGGVGAALVAFLDADLVEGTDYLLSRTGFADALAWADLIVTAEGALDLQTQSGKGPFYVAQEAGKLSKPVIMLAGSIPDNFYPSEYSIYDVVLPIGSRPQPLTEALGQTASNLERTAYQIGNMLALKNKKVS